MFIDYAKIELQAGNGGNGAVAFHREKYIDKGGPSGGDGGRGGDIVFQTNPNLHTLQDIRYKRMYKAKNGQSGGSNKRTGKSGEDLIIQVPCGTIIKSIESKSIIKDLVKENESHIICQGGIGGKGNFHFKSSTQQTPRFAQEGVKGQKLSIELELKVLADVGLVGLPNAGKSTLSSVMADIPGLIEGASKGKGLGHQFLKHIERNKILLFLVDVEEKNPNDVYNQLLDELVNFNKDLLDKDRIVVRTKIDTISEDADERWSSFSEEFIDISSVSNTGLNSLKDKLVSFLSA